MPPAMRAFFMIVVLASACTRDGAKRVLYDSLQHKAQMDCRQNPGAVCPEPESYDTYQRHRAERGK